MVVHVVSVGRMRDAPLRAACDEYARRARRTIKLDIHEVAEAGRRGGSPAEARRREAERLLGATPDRAIRVALTRTGDRLSSREFAARLRRWREGARDVALLIGGAFGLDPDLVRASQARLSLSSLTFPHELARLVLLEQLYRACTILEGQPYHKDTAR